MALERLLDNRITKIEDLRSLEKKPESKIEKHYGQLQQTSLWNAEDELWHEFISKDGYLVRSSPYYSATTQLLGVVIEGIFDKDKSSARYDKLKQSKLYDPLKQLWKNGYSVKTVILPPVPDSGDQLLDILISEELYGKEQAAQKFENLKRSRFYDSKRQQWNLSDGRNREVATFRQTANQLYGILAEGLFDPQKAKEQYHKLKQTHLYDHQTEQWLHGMNQDQIVDDHYAHRSARDQLLGIIVDAMFDKNTAKKKYEKLKKTVLYDNKRRQWNSLMSKDQTLISDDRDASSELLGVWVEKMLEDNTVLAQKEEAVPVVRRF